MILKDGLRFKNITIITSAVVIGLFTKGTAIVLLIICLGYSFFILCKYFKLGKIKWKHIILIFILTVVLLALFNEIYDIDKILSLGEGRPFIDIMAPEIIINYLEESTGMGRIKLTSNSYWSNLGWEENFIIDNLIYIIWIFEVAAERVRDALAVGAEVIVSGCAACKDNLRKGSKAIPKDERGKVKVMDHH